jgi:enoyl-[acyl-carrier protein] reductase/trans-2-enoyl-CoA reductase (NAD+)
MYRFFSHFGANRDELGLIRLDNLKMRDDVQQEVKAIWPGISTENVRALSDFEDYYQNFVQLFGFSVAGMDYEKNIEIS